MSEVKWFRVIDPLSPLYGCDVRGYDAHESPFDIPKETFLTLTALRRVDVFVGDRPFQLIAPEKENLGLLVLFQQLEPSPLQDDIVELSTDLPYGEFLEEVEDARGDGAKLHCVAYEQVYQIALLHQDRLLVSRIIRNDDDEIVRIRRAFERGDDIDDIKYMIERAV